MKKLLAIALLLSACSTGQDDVAAVRKEAAAATGCDSIEVKQLRKVEAMNNTLPRYSASGCGITKYYLVNAYGQAFEEDKNAPPPAYFNSFKFGF